MSQGQRSDELLTAREAAARLGISTRTLQRAIIRGALSPAWRTPGGHPRFHPGVIAAYAAARVARAGSTQLCADALNKHIVEVVPEGILQIDARGRVTYANPALADWLGRTRRDVEGASILTLVHPDSRHALCEQLAHRDAATAAVARGEVAFLYVDGSSRWSQVTTTALTDDSGRYTGTMAVVTDVDDRRRIKRTLRAANRALATIDACHRAIMDAQEEAEILDGACRAIVEAGRYRLAWIGRAEDDAARSIRPIAAAGATTYMTGLDVSWADTPAGRGPSGTAVRTGLPAHAPRITNDPSFARWRRAALKHGFASSLALPLRRGETVWGVLNIYSDVIDAFDAEETALLARLAGDLDYGLGALRARAEAATAAAALRASEARFRALTEHATDLLSIVDAAGIILYASPSHLTVLGYDQPALVGLDVFTLLHPEDREGARAEFARHTTDVAGRIELRVRHADGRWRWLDVVSRDHGNDPAVGGVVLTSRDVTERRAAAQATAEVGRRAALHAQRLAHIQRVGQELKADLDESAVGARIVEACVGLGYRMVALSLVDRPGALHARCRLVAAAGLPAEGEQTLKAHDFPLASVQELFAPTFRRSRSYFIPAGAVLTEAQLGVPMWTPPLANDGPDAWQAGDELLVPLTDREGDHLLGFISVDDPLDGKRPDIEAIEALEIFADQTVAALRSTRLLAEARRQAERDPVTGLFNHRAAHARLEAALMTAAASDTSVAVLALDLDDFKLINDAHGHQIGDLALRHVATLLTEIARAGDAAARLGGDEFLLILPGATREDGAMVAARLARLAEWRPFAVEGGTLPVRLSIGVAARPEDARSAQTLLGVADARLYEAKRAGGRSVETGSRNENVRCELEFDGFDMLRALVTAIDNKDRYTSEHSEQVAAYACAIADAIGLSRDTQRTLRLAGLLHDVGKIGVPDRVLRKPGPLDPDELAAMRRHVELSTVLVQAVASDPELVAAVAYHHERWDGRGYPYGAAGEAVPLLGRIMIVADAASAMAVDRPYRKGLMVSEIIAELRRGTGTHFDPVLVDPFIAVLSHPGALSA